MFGLLVQYYGFSLEEFFDEFGVEYQKVVFYGFGWENVDFCYFNDCGDIVKCLYFFEGILLNFEWCYCEIELVMVCEELVKFFSIQFCLDCYGICLCCEVWYVWVGDWMLLVIIVMLVGEVCEYVVGFSLIGCCGEIVVKIFKEICDCL